MPSTCGSGSDKEYPIKLSALSSIWRPIDLSYPTNRAIAGLFLLLAAGGTLYQIYLGANTLAAIRWGGNAAFGALLAWVLARELDPDHDLSAFVGVGLVSVGLPYFNAPDLASLFWLVLVIRLVNRVVGPPATHLDFLGLLGLTTWLAWEGNWGYTLLSVAAFVLDGQLKDPNRIGIAYAAGTAGLGVVVYAFRGSLYGESLPSWPLLAGMMGVAVAFIPAIAGAHHIESLTDRDKAPLNPARVQAAQVLALLAGLQIAVWQGSLGLVALAPFWAAVVGVVLYRLLVLAFKNIYEPSQK